MALAFLAGRSAADSCPVTTPNGRGIPGEYTQGNHGDGSTLTTSLWHDGKVTFKPGGPGCVDRDGSLWMKWSWWRGVPGKLTMEGRRLSGGADPLRAFIPPYGDRGFQVTSLIFPDSGCWEVTGRVGENALTFVVLVEKIAGGPNSPCAALFPSAFRDKPQKN
jgi:hypothetical protein